MPIKRHAFGLGDRRPVGQFDLNVELVAVDAWEELRFERRKGTETGRRQPFSLIFRSPVEARLQQGVFHLENDTLGELDLFLVTIGADKEGLRHEAVFT